MIPNVMGRTIPSYRLASEVEKANGNLSGKC